YRDTHRERVEELVASKHEGREIVLEAPAPAPKVVDLMAALEASVKAAGGSSARAAAKPRKAETTARSKAASAKAAAKPAEARRTARKKAS
ncbi:MAG: Ku protein, partial [Acidimicrobiales bacterium]